MPAIAGAAILTELGATAAFTATAATTVGYIAISAPSLPLRMVLAR